MAQRRHHYERAFEAYLRLRRIPYVAVDEARKALLPDGAGLRFARSLGEPLETLKSFDFVLYGSARNVLVDVKGRKVSRRMGGRSAIKQAIATRRAAQPPRPGITTPPRRGRLESWVTHDDLDSLKAWRALFGPGFESAFVFVYWCDEQPPDGLFQEIMEFQGRWYALRAITLDAYLESMKPRSVRWGTVDLPTAAFERLSRPFAPPWTDAALHAHRPAPAAP